MKTKIALPFLFIFTFVLNSSIFPQASFDGWTFLNSHDSKFKSLDFITESIGFAIDDSSRILKTTNTGTTWEVIYDFSNNHNLEIDFANSNAGLAFGYESLPGNDPNARVYRTLDGGYSWTRIMYGSTQEIFPSVTFPNENTGFIAGGFIYKTTNEGLNWTSINSTMPYLERLVFINANTGYSHKLSGNALYRTTNGGFNFYIIKDYSAEEYYVKKINFVNQNTGIATVIDPHQLQFNRIVTFYKTTNGGESWDSVTPQQSIIDFNNAFFLNGNIGYLSADKIYKTTDGGYSWQALNPLSVGAKNMYFYNQNLGFIYGLPGVLIRWTSGSSVFINNNNENLANDYKLNQNFPNPFNPSTTISFSLPKNDFAKIKIYDVTGKLISQILNEYKSMGYYEISFDASNLESGVYFYKIETSNFTQAKKMILLK